MTVPICAPVVARAASRKPRARSILVIAAVMRLVMVNLGVKIFISTPFFCLILILSAHGAEFHFQRIDNPVF